MDGVDRWKVFETATGRAMLTGGTIIRRGTITNIWKGGRKEGKC
jgi:hypothetical protein